MASLTDWPRVRCDDIVAYTYRADLLCPSCALWAVQPGCVAIKVELTLDDIARRKGIDRYDESSFDSSVFPKVVFRDQLDAEHRHCDDCGEEL
jgi:hypothetical protein